MKLRPYQELNLEALRQSYRSGHKAPLFVGPTGYGKTVLFAHITRNAVDRGRRVMILCHRAELIDQIVNALRQVGITPCIVAPDQPEFDARVYVASVWTLHNRLCRFPAPDLLVVDEAHHAVSKTTWGKILNHWPNAARLGVTATPCRLSGEGLGEMFDDLVLGPTTQELIDGGYLSPVTVYAPSTADISGVKKRGGDYVLSELETAMARSTVCGDAIAHYKRLAAGKRAVVFCVSVEHARSIATAFNEEGIKSENIDGSLDSEERKRRIKDFRDGRTLVLTSCDLVSEGFDLPAIEVGISLRPTASEGLWLQQVGRCLRTAAGKERAIILDHAGNTHRHGLPTDQREWSLKGREKKEAKEKAPTVRTCKHCFSCSPSTATACRNCGEPFPVNARKIKHIDGELSEVTQTPRKQRQRNDASSLDGLIALGRMRGYKNPVGWAQHVYQARKNKQYKETSYGR
jgi:DNA repair protein RadD